MPANARSKVDLPLPEGPLIKSLWPRAYLQPGVRHDGASCWQGYIEIPGLQLGRRCKLYADRMLLLLAQALVEAGQPQGRGPPGRGYRSSC